jgi:subtilisin family serine protease
MRVGVIDSGIHAGHPHVGGIAGGVAIAPDGSLGDDFIDRIGHGTAVAAVIREKAPDAELFAIKIFDRKLSAGAQTLARAIAWCAAHRIEWINLSLGTANPEHADLLQRAVDDALARGSTIVSAYEHDGVRWLPGSLAGAVPVLLDWNCPREQFRVDELPDGRKAYRASGYPRPIPGVSPERNLKGISFAVANVTGLLASSSISAIRGIT